MSQIIIREANFNDEKNVKSLCVRNSLVQDNCDQTWEWIWKKNPYYDESWPIGWILENNKKVVGYIGNIPRRYHFKKKYYIAGVARAFVVDEEYRNYSMRLLAYFFSQKEVDIFIFSSANEASSKVYEILKAKPIPQENYMHDFFWVLSPLKFTFSYFQKRGFPIFISYLLVFILMPLLHVEKFFVRRWKRKKFNYKIKPMNLNSENKSYHTLWNKYRNLKNNCFLTDRNYDAIKWQYNNCSARNRNAQILNVFFHKKCLGYMIISELESQKYNLRRLIIEDLILYDDNPKLIKFMLNEAYYYADLKGIDLLQMTGFNDTVQAVVMKNFKPFKRKYSYRRFWYYTNNQYLSSMLKSSSVWYACPFDGDTSL